MVDSVVMPKAMHNYVYTSIYAYLYDRVDCLKKFDAIWLSVG